MIENTCCFIGNRKITETKELREQLYKTVEDLIVEKKADTFLLGSKSRFNDLSREIVNELKEKYPHIKRIFVRAEFPYINNSYKKHLLENYEDTYFPEKAIGANRAVFVKRNYEMIDKSRFCVIYYDSQNAPTTRRSGAKIALDYAMKRNKTVIKFPNLKM